MAEPSPGALLGESPGVEALAPPVASAEPVHATAELLSRLVDDLTTLIRSPEGRHSKRNLNAFTDALKRVDYVRPEGGYGGEARDSLEEQVADQA